MASPYFPEDIGEEEAPPGGRIVRARFSAQSYGTLAQMAAATHMTASNVVRDALSLYWWLAREHGKGSRFLVQRDAAVTELVLPSLEGMDPLPLTEDGRQPPAERSWGERHMVDGPNNGRRA
jgi:hypothetical protein